MYFFVSFILLNFLLSIILNTISEASKRIETKSKMNQFRNLKPSIDAIIANDYIDFILQKSKNLIFNNRIMPKSLMKSQIIEDKPTNTTFNESSNPSGDNSNNRGTDEEADRNEFGDEENDAVYEPINEEDVLFPDYLAPDDNFAIRRAGVEGVKRGTTSSGFKRAGTELKFETELKGRKKFK
jgi:hypothetical protein